MPNCPARGDTNFPHAHLPQNHTLLPNTLSLELQNAIQLNASTWSRWALSPDQVAENPDIQQEYEDWVERMAFHHHSVAQLNHLEFDFRGNGVDALVHNVRSSHSHIQVVSMGAFFIHYDWMKDWMSPIREWLTIAPSCCQHSIKPSDDENDDPVVVHVREFDENDSGYSGLNASVYVRIMEMYQLTQRPLWIVCQPKSAGSAFVQELIRATWAQRATIVTGVDQYDAFCTLTRAKTLILSYKSSFSQMAALLAAGMNDAVEVHYPLTTLQEPDVTLAVPEWTYHFVNRSLDGIEEWNVGYDRIVTTLA